MTCRRNPGAYGHGMARCPLCTRSRSTFLHGGRLIFDHHTQFAARSVTEPCEGSGWLVEDNEVIR